MSRAERGRATRKFEVWLEANGLEPEVAFAELAEVATAEDNRGLRRGNEGRSDHSRHAGALVPETLRARQRRPGRIAGGPVRCAGGAAAASGLTGIKPPARHPVHDHVDIHRRNPTDGAASKHPAHSHGTRARKGPPRPASATMAYDILAPLDTEGRLDPAEWKAHAAACRVRRFHGGETDRVGLLRRKPGGAWFFDYEKGESDDETRIPFQ